MDSRLSVSSLCFPGMPVTEVLDTVAGIGATHTTLSVGPVTLAGPADVLEHSRRVGVGVEALIGGTGPMLHDPDTWPDFRSQVNAGVDVAAAVGARLVYMLTGSRRHWSWEEAVERFAAFMAPCIEHAANAGVSLAVEPANVLFADLTFVHTAASAFELTRRVEGLKVCLDLFHVWTEPDLRHNILSSAPAIGLVQVGDYVPGDRSLPARAVLGDGGIPIEDILGWLSQGGYQWIVDLELNGPRIDEEGHLPAARRGALELDRILGLSGPPAARSPAPAPPA
jgi:sugar phosphate isomerase/epimerase